MQKLQIHRFKFTPNIQITTQRQTFESKSLPIQFDHFITKLQQIKTNWQVMVREKKFTFSAYGQKDNSDENLKFSIIKVETMFNLRHGNTSHGPRHGNMLTPTKLAIAVKELVIEWDDYQTEACGYIQCKGIQDPTEYYLNMNGSLEKDQSNRKPGQNMIQLLRFVKKPGLKTTFIQIASENMDFLRLNMTLFPQHFRSTHESDNKLMRIDDIKLHLRSLFDENEILPIKNAHITVEIHATYPDQTQTLDN